MAGSTSVAGSRVCQLCPGGRFAEAGSDKCLHCPVGRAAALGRSNCSLCPPGRFSSAFSLECQDCPVGSSQAAWGQSKCLQDGVGQQSLLAGTAQPENAPGYYAVWDEDDFIGMEACSLRPAACLAQGRCAEGASGRHCFACLEGSSSTSCYQCQDRSVYVIIGLLVALLCVAFYTALAAVLTLTAASAQQPHMELLKLLLNHCAAASVLLSCFFRAVAAKGKTEPTLQWVVSYLMVTDGTPPSENWFLSLPCLFQPSRTQETAAAFARLAAASHKEYQSLALAEDRALLAGYQESAELRLLLCWFLVPLLGAWLPCLVLLLKLRWRLARCRQWASAMEFFTKVYFFGWEDSLDPRQAEMTEIFHERIWGFCWPLMHAESMGARARKKNPRGCLMSCGCFLLAPLSLPWLLIKWLLQLHRRRFLAETAPLRSAMLYCLGFAAARRCARGIICVQSGSTWVLYHSGAVQCTAQRPLHYLALAGGLTWVLWPLACSCVMWYQRPRMEREAFARRYAVMLLGYNYTRWWWEAMISARKFLLISAEVVPLEHYQRFLLIACVLILSLLGHVVLKPSDRRWYGLLNNLEICQLLVLLLLSFLYVMALELWLSTVLVVILSVLLHGAYLAQLAFCFCRAAVLDMHIEHPKLDDPKPGYRGRLVRWLIGFKKRQECAQPYIAYDNVHRFVSVLGKGGNVAAVPHLTSGSELLRAGYDNVRCKLSEVPAMLKAKPARGTLKRRGSQQEKLERVLQEASTSVPLQVRRQAARHLLFTVGWVAKKRSTFSSSLLDFVVRAVFMLADDSRESPEDGPQEVDKYAIQQANRQRDLLVIANMAKDFQLTVQPHEASEQTEREDASIGLLRVQYKVNRMYSPKIFRRGCTLQEVKDALATLRTTPPQELSLWLDHFERAWFEEFQAMDKELHLLAGTRLERGEQISSSEIVERTTNHKDVLEQEEQDIRICLKWVRFLLHYYCGGINVMSLTDVMRVRLTRESRRSMLEMTADPEFSDEESQAEPVDAAAWERVDQGLEAALAAGLQLEPDDDALMRLERGACHFPWGTPGAPLCDGRSASEKLM
ncbi:unnamed protein product [Effrenium voratum]|nr:unnamed protein product [Effrenium voratum]